MGGAPPTLTSGNERQWEKLVSIIEETISFNNTMKINLLLVELFVQRRGVFTRLLPVCSKVDVKVIVKVTINFGKKN